MIYNVVLVSAVQESKSITHTNIHSLLDCFPPTGRHGVLSKWTEGLNSHIYATIYMGMKVAQSCLTLCDPMDYRVHGILQARILERVAFPFFRGPS